MSFKPIEDYGVIGNQCTAALVAVDGSIDFFCFPNFDSPSIFAALLDSEKRGSFRICPQEKNVQRRQEYLAESNVLATRFLTDSAVAELTDFMPITESSQKGQITRIVHMIRGSMSFELLCQPAFDYARSSHTVRVERNHAAFVPENGLPAGITLRASVPLRQYGQAARATFTLQQDERAAFTFGTPEDSPDLDLSLEKASQDCHDTLDYWRKWIRKSTYAGRWRESVHRSALILKLMVSRRYGSLVAAPTFGLPEHIGGSRNWDYRFVWVRDAAFTLYSFMRIGMRSEADQFFEWLRGQIAEVGGEGQPLQIMYGLDGRRQLVEEQLGHLSGYRDSKPVKVGNAAYDQLQLDIYGELLDAVYLYTKYGFKVPYEGWQKIQEVLAWLSYNWEQPDKGIWEVRGEDQHLLHSRLMCWVAFDRAIRLAHKRSLSAPLQNWYRHRDAILEDIHRNFWNDDLQAFTQRRDGKFLDASVLLMPLMHFISPVDPRWLSTLAAVERTLAEDSFVYRYRNDDSSDGLDGEEGSFTCCSFWFVECLARAGQTDKAQHHFEKLLSHANHLGLFSEQIGRDGRQLGNFPQALSHLSLISAAIALDRALSGTPPTPWGQ